MASIDAEVSAYIDLLSILWEGDIGWPNWVTLLRHGHKIDFGIPVGQQQTYSKIEVYSNIEVPILEEIYEKCPG